ncbi:hypothetical protein O6H91_09G068000 [Diphasiastrum complanatum]|uniref:Uncharacterized protein n=1 Tax=Diphasiastrum complanatum TaxID=34168 RepID=A0ACC2CQC9_DIPCM|nr:hypothetical protein O6H91_09G068000 [Diphasiastrum complanatum]
MSMALLKAIVVLVMALITLMNTGCGLVLSKSDLTTCVDSGDGTALDCNKKILLGVVVPSGQSSGSETFVTELKEVQDTINGGRSLLKTPQRITISKSQVYIAYPLEYFQSFVGNPWEEVILTRKCDADQKSNKPTCGWYALFSTFLDCS